MKTDDLFNAINDIDPKYVTDAWNNTASEEDTVVYESTKFSKGRIIGAVTAFAALISAACLAVYVRVGQLPNDNITSESSPLSAGISETASTAGGLSVADSLIVSDSSGANSFLEEAPAADSELPITMYGPDMIQIKYGDVTGVTLEGGKVAAAKDFDPSNWESVICDGFTYLAGSSGGNWIDFRDEGDEPFSPLKPGAAALSESYKRYNVGDKIGDLTVKSAMTVFHKNSEAAGKLWECIVEFEGEVTVNAYIVREVNVNTTVNWFRCLLPIYEEAIPVMSPTGRDVGYESKIYINEYLDGTIRSSGVHPDFYLENDNNIPLQNVIDPFKDENCAAVTMKLSNIRMDSLTYAQSDDYIIANIEDIKDYTGNSPEGALPFELYGLDHKQILFDDVTEIVDEKTNKIENDDLTADNWYQIWCKRMCYLGTPVGENHNSLDEPYSFDSENNGQFVNYFANMHEYKRYNIGDRFGNLTVSAVETVFFRTSDSDEHEELPMAQKMRLGYVQFDGQTTLRAYLTHDRNGNLSCIPLNGETSLPILYPGDDFYSAMSLDGCFESTDGTQINYRTELPQIRLNNVNGLTLSEYFGDKDYAKVELTLDNVSLTYSRLVEQDCGITADIAGISAI